MLVLGFQESDQVNGTENIGDSDSEEKDGE